MREKIVENGEAAVKESEAAVEENISVLKEIIHLVKETLNHQSMERNALEDGVAGKIIAELRALEEKKLK
jgi:hypothetical protein